MSNKRTFTITVLLAFTLLFGAACQPGPVTDQFIDVLNSTDSPTPAVDIGTAESLRRIDVLTVAPESGADTYSRDLYKHWVDVDGNGCDTREEVLIAESTTPAQVDPYGCKVLTGDWYSAYDGVTTEDPSTFDIDHMIPLAEAHRSGASTWTAAKREAFANDFSDPDTLIAVTASSNRSKGDRDPAEWKPTNTAYHCEYANDWVRIKDQWDLTVDTAEKAALNEMLATC